MITNETDWQAVPVGEVKLYSSHADYENDFPMMYKSLNCSVDGFYRLSVYGSEVMSAAVEDFEGFADGSDKNKSLKDFSVLDFAIADIAMSGRTVDLYVKGDADVFVKYDGKWVDVYDFSGSFYKSVASTHKDEVLGLAVRLKRSHVSELILCSAFSGLSATELNDFIFDTDLSHGFNFDEADNILLLHFKF